MSQPRGVGKGPRSHFAAWLHHHRVSASDSLAKLLHAPFSTLLTWLVLGVALALPATLLLVLENVQQISESLARPAQLSLMLSDEATEADVDALIDRLTRRPEVDRVAFISKDQVLEQFAADTGLTAVIATLPANPLPATIQVYATPGTDSVGLEIMASTFIRLSVVDEAVLDTRWVSRLQAIVEIGQRLSWGLGLMMIVGAVLILANTIRLAIEARRDEIVVIKLIGGGDGFARRPFLYTGLWFGIGGGLLGACIVSALFFVLSGPVNALFALYDSQRVLTGFGFLEALKLLLVGGLLGVVSAWQSALLHLRQVEPR